MTGPTHIAGGKRKIGFIILFTLIHNCESWIELNSNQPFVRYSGPGAPETSCWEEKRRSEATRTLLYRPQQCVHTFQRKVDLWTICEQWRNFCIEEYFLLRWRIFSFKNLLWWRIFHWKIFCIEKKNNKYQEFQIWTCVCKSRSWNKENVTFYLTWIFLEIVQRTP